jgi:spore germination protein GerM
MKKYILLVLALALLFTLPAGCKKEEPTPDPEPMEEQPSEQSPINVEKEILLFFPDKGNNFLLPEFRKIIAADNATTDLIAEMVLEELLRGPSNDMLKPIADKDTKVLSLKLHNDTATVDFSEEFINSGLSSKEKLLQVYSVVNTLSELDIEEVFILIEGDPVTDHYTSLKTEMPFIRDDELIPSK